MKKNILILIFILSLSSCIDPVKKQVIDGFAQGTTYHVAYHSDKGTVVEKSDIDSVLNLFNKSCSLHDKNSLLVAINANTSDSVDLHIAECIRVAQMLHDVSGGLYDITIKPLTEAYGFIKKDQQQKNINLDSILNFIGMEKISIEGNKIVKTSPSIEIDLNSIAQGYSVDLLSKFMEEQGLTDYIVEIGGEIFARGNNRGQGWRVGIDKPIDGSYISGQHLQAIIILENKGLTTSGNYRKFFTDENGKRVNHTINPKTGESSQNSILSVTVVADNATLADGYTTTFMLMGKERSVEYLNNNKNLEAMIVYSEGDSIKTYITEGLNNNIKILE